MHMHTHTFPLCIHMYIIYIYIDTSYIYLHEKMDRTSISSNEFQTFPVPGCLAKATHLGNADPAARRPRLSDGTLLSHS